MGAIFQERGDSSSSSGTHPERFDVQPTVNTHFAWLRTRLSVERTLMAWVRTATALIAFGFTIVQVFERFQQSASSKPVLLPHAPRDFGLLLIGCGVVGSILALSEYRRAIRYMWCGEFQAIAGMTEKPYKSPLVAMAIMVSLIGVVAFSIVLFRVS
jgi:putative membrane protein